MLAFGLVSATPSTGFVCSRCNTAFVMYGSIASIKYPRRELSDLLSLEPVLEADS